MKDLDWAKWADIAFKVLLAAVAGLMFVNGMQNKTDANTAALTNIAETTGKAIANLAAEVHDLRADIKLLPGYEARIAGLEHRGGDYQGMFVGLDGRLRTVEDGTSRNSQDISNIKAASGKK